MKKYKCIVCGYIYDPAENDNVAFSDLPEDWVCPECGAGKDQFEEVQEVCYQKGKIMTPREIKKHICRVGGIDWDMGNFHGHIIDRGNT